MMKKLIGILIGILLFAETASANVVINQVLYDPLASESTGEAVEMYNSGDLSADISGWMLRTGASEQDAVIPADTILQPGEYYLIADKGWNTSKQAGWREADLEETISLYNSDSGIALLDYNFNTLDAVGWGNVNDTGLYEGAPADPVSPGMALKRVNDTDNNLADFIEAEADFSEKSTANSVVLEVNVVSPLDFDIVIFPDDGILSGVQVMPVPGDYKPVIVRANTTENLTLYATLENQTKQMQLVNSMHEAVFDLPFSMKPGKYNATVGYNNFEKQQEFEYLGLTALEIDTAKIVFDNAVPGKDVYVYGDRDMNTAGSATIQNIGNTNLDVSVYGTDLVSGNERISAGNVMFSFDNNFDYVLSSQLDYTGVLFSLGLAPALTSELGFKLSVPAEAAGGKYTGKISVIGAGNG